MYEVDWKLQMHSFVSALSPQQHIETIESHIKDWRLILSNNVLNNLVLQWNKSKRGILSAFSFSNSGSFREASLTRNGCFCIVLPAKLFFPNVVPNCDKQLVPRRTNSSASLFGLFPSISQVDFEAMVNPTHVPFCKRIDLM